MALKEFITWILDKTNPHKIMFIVLLISGIVLFLPEKYIILLAVHKLTPEEKLISFLVFIGAVAFFVWDLGERIVNKRKLDNEHKKKTNVIKSHLKSLDLYEKSVLREFLYFQKQNTLLLPILNPVISGLVFKGILERINDKTEIKGNYEFSVSKITDLAYSKITNEMIGIRDNMSREEINEIEGNRPNFKEYWEPFH